MTPRRRFGELFSDVGVSPADRPTTVLQSLALMNGEFVDEATQAKRSRLLGAVTGFPGFAAADQIEVLFLATLSRPPTAAERDELKRFVEQPGEKRDSAAALGDLFWALLNSSEFLYNH